jgi:hypothetical protein
MQRRKGKTRKAIHHTMNVFMQKACTKANASL